MGKVIAGLWIVALLFGGFWFGYYQEGANRDIIIKFEMEGKASGMPMELESGTIYITRSRIAIVGKGKGGETSKLVIDMKEKKVRLVSDKDKVVMTMPIKVVDKSECEPPKAVLFTGKDKTERLADAKTIAGLRCHAFKSGEGRQAAVLWLTYELPLGRDHVNLINKVLRIELALGGEAGGPSGRSGGKRPQVSGFQYFPLPLRADVRSRQGRFHFEVTSIKHGKVDEDVFEIPSGYNELDLQELFKGLGGRG